MDIFYSLIPIAEIAIIAVMINYLLAFFWNTRSMDLLLGLVAFILMFAASSWFQLPVLNQIMRQIASVAMIAILVIFQPEVRVTLSKLSLKGKRFKEISEFDKFLDQLASSIYRLSEKRVGALIALENEDSLEEYVQKGVLLKAQFTSELLESIFSTFSPLHDGAVIIKNTILVAAGVILPLADDSQQLKGVGTRHRAGLGAAQKTDALVIVISEESGKVSIAREGMMTQGIKIDRFKAIIRSLFNPPPKPRFEDRFKLMEWLKR